MNKRNFTINFTALYIPSPVSMSQIYKILLKHQDNSLKKNELSVRTILSSNNTCARARVRARENAGNAFIMYLRVATSFHSVGRLRVFVFTGEKKFFPCASLPKREPGGIVPRARARLRAFVDARHTRSLVASLFVARGLAAHLARFGGTIAGSSCRLGSITLLCSFYSELFNTS